MKTHDSLKETPIIFSTEMVKAEQDGRKTMTRRTTGLDKINENPDSWGEVYHVRESLWRFVGKSYETTDGNVYPVKDIKCPYGQVGDLLWMRETWAVNPTMDEVTPRDISSVAFVYYKIPEPNSILVGKWRPSIHMPKWACRIWLEITDIRVERLQEITEEAIYKEGYAPFMHTDADGNVRELSSGLIWFSETIWDSLNEKRGYGWEVNPWVWVITFKETRLKGSRCE